jgi:ornithine cyclodeaminase
VDCRSCIIWGRDGAKVRALIERLRESPASRAWGLEFHEAPDMDFLTSRCELIVTTTSARAPLIRADQVRQGTHITAVGSDDHGKQELEAALLIENPTLGRADDHQITVADLTGVAIQDIQIATMVNRAFLPESEWAQTHRGPGC